MALSPPPPAPPAAPKSRSRGALPPPPKSFTGARPRLSSPVLATPAADPHVQGCAPSSEGTDTQKDTASEHCPQSPVGDWRYAALRTLPAADSLRTSPEKAGAGAGKGETDPEPGLRRPCSRPVSSGQGLTLPGKNSSLFPEALPAAHSPPSPGQPTAQGQGQRTVACPCPTVLCRAASLHQGPACTGSHLRAHEHTHAQACTHTQEHDAHSGLH